MGAKSLGSGAQVFNLVPQDAECAFEGIGRTIAAGRHLDERIKLYGQVGHIYLTIEGGPGVAKEALAAYERGAKILPIMWTGGASNGLFGFPEGALRQPDWCTTQQWMQLKAQGDTQTPEVLVEATARTVLEVIKSLVEHHPWDQT